MWLSSYELLAYGDLGVYPPQSKPYGLTYGQWVGKWWQWALSLPNPVNPMADKSGANCAESQQGPVWFLAGTVGGAANRACSVPFGKAILLNILSTECSKAENPKDSPADLLQCAKEQDDGGVVRISASVDGTDIKNLKMYRFQSPVFPVTFPVNDVFGVSSDKPVPTISVADGWYVMLKPLSPGAHVIHLFGQNLPPPNSANQPYTTEVTYHINVPKS
ncbi:MAG TPA: hypothetical protein VH500_02705 [Nitrososphaeraceae archaeon]